VKFTQQINNLTESLSGKKGLTQGIILVLLKEDGKWKIFDMACNPTNNRNCNNFFQITVEYTVEYTCGGRPEGEPCTWMHLAVLEELRA